MTSANKSPLTLGFLTVLQESNGHVGVYFVTNQWGLPLDFRLTSAVQPNKVQQVLYGGTLLSYLCADLIGKALFQKAAVAAHLVVTDREPVLDLRLKVEVPVVWLVGGSERPAGEGVVELADGKGWLVCHGKYPGDVEEVRALLEQLERGFDLAEPFVRIREAVGEARKMGVTGRAAA